MFANRRVAGKELAKKLVLFKNDQRAIVVAIPNGGVMTAYPIAKELNIPLEIQLIKKISHPDQPDHILGAVSLKSSLFNTKSNVPVSYFETERKAHENILYNQYDQFIGRRAVLNLLNKTIILVDDGIQSGNTIQLALQLIKKQKPSRIILAIPIAPKEVIDELKHLVDEVICLKHSLTSEWLIEHYQEFQPVRDTTVIRLLRELIP